ncbi:type VI secretion system Vgr family protein [Sorangium sp. So ce233]|uniref:type VI secretion system Vgr family protein n=1 Tax=Sorangium sp. So ce233 TaxID=3133290 RepID=UPI003F5E6D3B
MLASGGDVAARHDEAYGTTHAERTLAAERTWKRSIHFDTNALDICPGVVLAIEGHAHPEVDDQKLLVLETEMSFDVVTGAEWSTSVHAVPTNEPYRPPRKTAKPRVRGFDIATTVGPPGQEVHTDEFGRVRVQFPWDRDGKSDDTSSCWMRVSQGWTGIGFGMMHIPRVGQEILVAFIDGNCDQPVVVGRVYNQIQRSAYLLPEDRTRSVWRSDSSPGSGGFNEISFEDKKDEEFVYMQAQKNRRRLVKNDETITIGRDRTERVAANETDTTGGDRVEVTRRDRLQDIGGSRNTKIGGDRARLVKGSETEQIDGAHAFLVAKDQHVLVKGERRERVELDSHLHVKGSRYEAVDGTLSLGTGSLQESVAKKHALEAGDEIHLASSKKLVGEGSADVTVKGPGGFLRIDGGGVTIQGTLVKINVGGSSGSGSGAQVIKPAEPKEEPVSAPAAVASQTVDTAPLLDARVPQSGSESE